MPLSCIRSHPQPGALSAVTRGQSACSAQHDGTNTTRDIATDRHGPSSPPGHPGHHVGALRHTHSSCGRRSPHEQSRSFDPASLARPPHRRPHTSNRWISPSLGRLVYVSTSPIESQVPASIDLSFTLRFDGNIVKLGPPAFPADQTDRRSTERNDMKTSGEWTM
jgi:hypothetical protein